MTDKELARIVAEGVEEALTNNESNITKGLAAGLAEDDRVDPITVLLIIKSMRLTAQITAQITIRLLEAFGSIDLPPDAPPDLRIIDGGVDP